MTELTGIQSQHCPWRERSLVEDGLEKEAGFQATFEISQNEIEVETEVEIFKNFSIVTKHSFI